jgi:hypothetical protein
MQIRQAQTQILLGAFALTELRRGPGPICQNRKVEATVRGRNRLASKSRVELINMGACSPSNSLITMIMAF